MPSLGTRLKAAREAKGVSLSEASAATRIKLSQLEDIEKDDYSSVPAPTYAKGFLKIYAQFLGLPAEEVISDFNELQANKKPKGPALAAPKPKAAKKGFLGRRAKETEGDETEAGAAAEPISESSAAPTREASPVNAAVNLDEFTPGEEPPAEEADPISSSSEAAESEPEEKKVAPRLVPDFALDEKSRKKRAAAEAHAEEEKQRAKAAAAAEAEAERARAMAAAEAQVEKEKAQARAAAEARATEAQLEADRAAAAAKLAALANAAPPSDKKDALVPAATEKTAAEKKPEPKKKPTRPEKPKKEQAVPAEKPEKKARDEQYFGEKAAVGRFESLQPLLVSVGAAVLAVVVLGAVINRCNSRPSEAVSFTGVELPQDGLLMEPPEPYLKLE